MCVIKYLFFLIYCFITCFGNFSAYWETFMCFHLSSVWMCCDFCNAISLILVHFIFPQFFTCTRNTIPCILLHKILEHINDFFSINPWNETAISESTHGILLLVIFAFLWTYICFPFGLLWTACTQFCHTKVLFVGFFLIYLKSSVMY